MLIHSKQHKPEAAVAVESYYYLCQQVMWSVELVCFHAVVDLFEYFTSGADLDPLKDSLLLWYRLIFSFFGLVKKISQSSLCSKFLLWNGF